MRQPKHEFRLSAVSAACDEACPRDLCAGGGRLRYSDGPRFQSRADRVMRITLVPARRVRGELLEYLRCADRYRADRTAAAGNALPGSAKGSIRRCADHRQRPPARDRNASSRTWVRSGRDLRAGLARARFWRRRRDAGGCGARSLSRTVRFRGWRMGSRPRQRTVSPSPRWIVASASRSRRSWRATTATSPSSPTAAPYSFRFAQCSA